MLRTIATTALLASCLALGGCPQAPESAPADQAEDNLETSAIASDGVLTVSLNNAEAITIPANECVIVNDGANGVVRGGDADGSSAYELGWADGTTRFIWDTGQGIFNGDVAGAVEGATITFEGASNGLAVAGSATCS
ncbi:MAG: hypothetical protein R3C16_10475 [Hyphomonadaceae bacterium]